jgi:uncharacterized protein
LFNQRSLNEGITAMMTQPTPDQVLERRRELLLNHDTDGFAGLFAEDAVIELPFTSPGLPSRLEGQEAIREFSRRVAAAPMRISDLEEIAVHHTEDPEVVVVELAAKVTVPGTGATFATRSVQVFRIHEGKILLFRDYANPRALSEALGNEEGAPA